MRASWRSPTRTASASIPDALVETLGVGARQRVEIAKVLYLGARILILDEPTAVLVPQEVDELFANLRELKAEGLTVLFISHKLDEVLSVADEITVIRRGTTVRSVLPKETSARQLAELMVGSELPVPELRESTVTDEIALEVSGHDRAHRRRAARPSTTSASRSTAARSSASPASRATARPNWSRRSWACCRPTARVRLGGADISRWSTRKRREAGIGYIPEDRHRHGLLLEAPLWENRILGHQTEEPNSRGPFINGGGARRDTKRIVDQFDVRTPGIGVPAASLSGGNQQKLIVGREMSGTPRVLIAAHPTRGVDVGAQAAIWDHLRAARADGPSGAADLRRPRRAHRDVRHAQGDPSWSAGRGRRPARRHAGDPRCRDDRRRGRRRTDRRRRRPRPPACATRGRPTEGQRVMSDRMYRLLLNLVAVVVAALFAGAVTSLILLVRGDSPSFVISQMWDFGTQPSSELTIVNSATVYYFSAVAVAIGFRMNLFNIGVDGQYRLAAMLAAAFAGAVSLPTGLRQVATILVAMLVGAAWAGLVAILKVWRGVSEVISTIMLNTIATSLIAYLMRDRSWARAPATMSPPRRSRAPVRSAASI